MVTVTGRLRAVEIEVPHFEVEPWPEEGETAPAEGAAGTEAGEGGVASAAGEARGRYVLIPADEEVARLLAASVGVTVRVRGFRHEGPSIFMRGPLLRVVSVVPLEPRRA